MFKVLFNARPFANSHVVTLKRSIFFSFSVSLQESDADQSPGGRHQKDEHQQQGESGKSEER